MVLVLLLFSQIKRVVRHNRVEMQDIEQHAKKREETYLIPCSKELVLYSCLP